MRILLATFATPTITSELYEWTLVDLSQIYETRAFGNAEQAIAWADEQIKAVNEDVAKDNASMREMYGENFDGQLETLEFLDDRTDATDTRFILWSPNGSPELTSPEELYVLRLKWQDVEIDANEQVETAA